MILPEWLYEPLPYVYATSGLASAIFLESALGKLSGVLLISAALVISYQRYAYRRLARERQKRLEFLQETRRKRKEQRHAWLQDQARIYQERIAKRDEDLL